MLQAMECQRLRRVLALREAEAAEGRLSFEAPSRDGTLL